MLRYQRTFLIILSKSKLLKASARFKFEFYFPRARLISMQGQASQCTDVQRKRDKKKKLCLCWKIGWSQKSVSLTWLSYIVRKDAFVSLHAKTKEKQKRRRGKPATASAKKGGYIIRRRNLQPFVVGTTVWARYDRLDMIQLEQTVLEFKIYVAFQALSSRLFFDCEHSLKFLEVI